MTPHADETQARERSTPLTMDQLREDQLRREGLPETRRAPESDLTGSAAPEAEKRRRNLHHVPRLQDEGWISRLCAVYPESPAAVRFRHLAVRVRAMLDDLPLRSLLITSAVAGEGKTTVSVNTALALASIAPESRIALVDLDLRRGRIGGVFDYQSDLGIEHVLSGEIDLEDACVETDIPALDFYPIGKTIPDAHRLLGASADRVLRELHARYDYVICDGPPVLPVPDIPLLAPQVGGCMAVVASGRSKHAQFKELLELVPKSAMLGVFLNESPGATGEGKYKYYDPVSPDSGSKVSNARGTKS
ncbi:MAG: CpsD/CapB family tyrosine-protein kinase [Myxococcota bacterium]